MEIDLVSIRKDGFIGGSDVTNVIVLGDVSWINFADGLRIELTRTQLEQIVAKYHKALELESFIYGERERRSTLSA